MRWFTFFLFFFQLVKANSQELFFSSPPVFQNLPSFETYDILQDRKGFIWVTTDFCATNAIPALLKIPPQDEELDMKMDIPTMLIQTYVENSIWHELMPKKSGGILFLVAI